jgi:hypothetical protein
MSGFRDILASTAADMTSGAIADVGDTYQEILMSDAAISPPDAMGAQQFEAAIETVEPDVGGVELESYDHEPDHAAPGLDIA